jgi:uncharacterized protein
VDDVEKQITPIDLEALDRYLDSDLSPDDCMGLFDLDGFLTGVVIGPPLVQPDEWMAVIWGDEEPEFESDAQRRMVFDTILGRCAQITICFDSDPYQFEPLFMEGPNGEVIASDWAGGFPDAVALRPKAWVRLLIDRQAKIMIEPFLVLNGDAELPAGRDGAADEAKFMSEAPDLISTCVLGIHEFWKKSRRRQKSAPSRGRKPTR